MTRTLTGRAARALRNDLVRTVESAGTPVLGWPYQALAAQDVNRAAIATDDAAWAPLLAGQGLRLARGTSSAAEIIASLKEEVELALQRLHRPG